MQLSRAITQIFWPKPGNPRMERGRADLREGGRQAGRQGEREGQTEEGGRQRGRQGGRGQSETG